MRTFLLPILLASPVAAQQTDYTLELDPQATQITWNVTTSAGNVVENPPVFALLGDLVMRFDAPAPPFANGEIMDALVGTLPGTISGEIPNPLPFLPPLATFDLVGVQMALQSGSFSIDPAGNFTANGTITTTAGKVVLGGLLGSGSQPFFGLTSAPGNLSGTVSQVGNDLEVTMTINVQLNLVLSGGITVDVDLSGPVEATVPLAEANPFTLAVPRPVLTGQQNLFEVRHAGSGPLFLGVSLAGLGSTPIGPLGVTADIASPYQAGGPVFANANGVASFNLVPPGVVAGRSLWFQCVGFGQDSNVVGSWAQ